MLLKSRSSQCLLRLRLPMCPHRCCIPRTSDPVAPLSSSVLNRGTVAQSRDIVGGASSLDSDYPSGYIHRQILCGVEGGAG